MPRFGWMRLACLLLILTALVSLVRLGGPGAEARSLAARVPDLSFGAPEPRESAGITRWTEDQISSLEDARGLGDGTDERLQAVVEPRVKPPAPAATTEEGRTRDAGRETRAGAGGPREVAEARAVPAPDPPVFYRPVAPGAAAPGSARVCGDLGGLPRSSRIVFPLEREFFYSYEDTWGAPRTQGGHEGTDLMTPAGVPEYAVTDGTVVPVAGSNAGGWNSLGGYAVMVRADYSIGPVRKGDLFYYAHLQRPSDLKIGARVNAGQVVGYAGDTGQGPEVTRGLFPPHLHLGWYDGTGGRSAADSGAMNPYPLLEWIKSNGGAVTGGSDARFCEAPRPGPPTPSAGPGPWPTPTNPGATPDLDTGSNNPTPTPAAAETTKPPKKPAKPSRPDRPPEKPNSADRPQTPKPQKPIDSAQGPPERELPKPVRPTSDQEDQDVQIVEQTGSNESSTEDQYDAKTSVNDHRHNPAKANREDPQKPPGKGNPPNKAPRKPTP